MHKLVPTVDTAAATLINYMTFKCLDLDGNMVKVMKRNHYWSK